MCTLVGLGMRFVLLFLSVHGCVLMREHLVYALPIQDGEALVLPFVGVAVLAVA